MAKTTLGKLSNPAFTAAMQELLTKSLPVKTAFKLKGLTNLFNGELAKFGELRKAILDKHCKKNEDGSPDVDANSNYQFDPEALPLVTTELNDLLSIEVEFNHVSIDELGNIDVTAQTLFDLGDIVQ